MKTLTKFKSVILSLVLLYQTSYLTIAEQSPERKFNKTGPLVITPPSPSVDRSFEMQEQRRILIKQLQIKKIVYKIEQVPGGTPHLYTDILWDTLSFHQKQRLVSVVSEYAGLAKDRYCTAVHDGLTNKQIGSFDQKSGLRLN